MKIAVIQTGGTIDKDYPKSMGGDAFEIGEPAAKRIFAGAKHSHEVVFYELLKKDSLDITNTDRQLLADFCNGLNEQSIIITLGSDTLLETASFLAERTRKTIILTASMIPERFKDSDADFNLGMAVAGIQLLDSGVYVAIQGLIAPWQKLTRNQISGQFELLNS